MTLIGLDKYRRTAFATIPGWMHELDLRIFGDILSAQLDAGIDGDILEIGSYHGKSAIALGYGLCADESLTVCDLFGLTPDGVPTEGIDDYAGLTIEAFERQYARFHARSPIIHTCPSSELALDGQEFRFVHIDGGHAYGVVRDDITLVDQHVLPGDVVALDDYRSAHTPGVAAAAWEAVSCGVLYPFLLSEVKMYATHTLAAQRFWFDKCSGFDLPRESHTMHGYDVLRMWSH